VNSSFFSQNSIFLKSNDFFPISECSKSGIFSSNALFSSFHGTPFNPFSSQSENVFSIFDSSDELKEKTVFPLYGYVIVSVGLILLIGIIVLSLKVVCKRSAPIFKMSISSSSGEISDLSQ
jgi:hypothetical protein